MHYLPRYKWYLASAALVALARWSIVVFLVLLLSSRFTQVSPASSMSVAFGVLAVCGSSVFAIALWLRCPICAKRLQLTWNPDNPESQRIQALPLWKRVKDVFFPSELSSREVCCVHCGTRLHLRSEA